MQAFILAAAMAATTTSAVDLRDVVKKVQPAVVFISTTDLAGEPSGQGSGFFIAPQRVVTNVHVLRGAGAATVRLADGRAAPVAEVLAWNAEADLVVFSVPATASSKTVIALADRKAELGEHVVLFGNPLGLQSTVSDGIVSSLRPVPGYDEVVQITAPMSPGSSGGPLVDMSGKLLGVATMQMREGQNLNFAMPAAQVRALAYGKPVALRAWNEAKAGWPAKEILGAGVRAYVQEEFEDARALLERGIAADPGAKPLHHLLLGCAYYKLGDHKRAVRELEAYVKPEGALAYGYTCLAGAYAAAGKKEKALSTLDVVATAVTDSAQVHYEAGLLYGALGEHRRAVEAQERAIKIDEDFAPAYVAVARRAYDVDEYEAAERLARRAIEADSENLGAYLVLGDTALETKQNDLAAKAYRQVLARDADSLNALRGFTVIALRKQDHSNAAVIAERTVTLEPGDVRNRMLYGLALEGQERHTEAAREYGVAVTLAPQDARPPFRLGVVLAAQNDSHGAERAYETALRRDPKYAPAYKALITLLREEREWDKTKAVLGRWIDAAPEDPEMHGFVCGLFVEKEEYANALDACAEAARLDSQSAARWEKLGSVYRELKRYAESAAAYEKAAALDPDTAYYQTSQALALVFAERPAEACPIFRTAVRTDPQSAMAHFGMGYCYWYNDDQAGALREYGILKTLDQGWADRLFKLIYPE